eukprot:s2794_g5.t1
MTFAEWILRFAGGRKVRVRVAQTELDLGGKEHDKEEEDEEKEEDEDGDEEREWKMTQQGFDPGIFQAALLQIAEATKAANSAAQAAQSAGAQAASTAASSAGPAARAQVDWSKLVNNPPVFDCPNQEQDQRHFRDWLWQLCQYLICVDEGFSKELGQITEEPSKAVGIESGPLDVRAFS